MKIRELAFYNVLKMFLIKDFALMRICTSICADRHQILSSQWDKFPGGLRCVRRKLFVNVNVQGFITIVWKNSGNIISRC